MGVLGEEAAQRLLSIFAEAATCCLVQLKELALQHGIGKHDALFEVGLNLVLKWDVDIATEETSRMELAYPEISSLHAYVFLWLLDILCSNKNLHTPAIPVIGEIYAAFMKRVADHRDVRKGVRFLETHELVRRSVYVDAFRWVYHDVVQTAIRRRVQYSAEYPAHLVRSPRETHVLPQEAASQIGSLQRFDAHEESLSERAHSIACGLQPDTTSALKLAMTTEAAAVVGHAAGHAAGHPSAQWSQSHPNTVFSLPTLTMSAAVSEENNQVGLELSEVAPHSASSASGGTKAVTLKGPCFFREPGCSQKAPPI